MGRPVDCVDRGIERAPRGATPEEGVGRWAGAMHGGHELTSLVTAHACTLVCWGRAN